MFLRVLQLNHFVEPMDCNAACETRGVSAKILHLSRLFICAFRLQSALCPVFSVTFCVQGRLGV